MDVRPKAQRRRPHVLPQLMLTALALSALPRCACDEAEQFIPGARYEPDTLLDFGEVSVADEKTLSIVVRSNGSASLRIADAQVEGAAEKFTVNVFQDLVDGLAPGRTSTITVSYRPCPDAWVGNSLKEDFDYNTCPGSPDAADLVITDNTPQGSARITLSGQPVQPPVITVLCPVGAACGVDEPNMTECNGMAFGTVAAGDTPCDLIIEVQNAWRNDKPVGDLSIERMEVVVKKLDDGRFYSAAEAGFSLVDLGGSPLNVDTASPFVVAITDGATEGSKRFKIRFSGIQTGLFRGEQATMTGLRLFTNDPDRPLVTAPITAIGSAADLTILPDNRVNFGPVEQGLTKTSTRTIANFGDANLVISDMRVASGNNEVVFSTTRGSNFPITLMPNESMDVFIRYTPVDTGQDVEELTIASNDPEDPSPDVIFIRGGAVPTIEVDPSDTLVFALPQPPPPPPLPPRRECLTISNVGFGDLIIDEVEMLGSDNTANHPSVDDFEIEGIAACAGTNKCDPGITLCPPGDPSCTTSSTQLCVVYDNNDISVTDLVNFLIRSNDPVTPEIKVVLDATDVPCFFPTPVITVETPRPCMGQPVRINADSSDPGGDASGNTTITRYSWSWFFAQPPNPTFMPADQSGSLFIPERGGVYIIRLDLENSCGARSQTAGQETVNVASSGCN
jgi:hypothetical protein